MPLANVVPGTIKSKVSACERQAEKVLAYVGLLAKCLSYRYIL